MNAFDQDMHRYIEVLNKLLDDKITHDNFNSEETCQEWENYIELRNCTR